VDDEAFARDQLAHGGGGHPSDGDRVVGNEVHLSPGAAHRGHERLDIRRNDPDGVTTIQRGESRTVVSAMRAPRPDHDRPDGRR